MRLLLIGAPGAGKGTQAIRLAQHFGITHISSGDLLRKHIADQTSLGTSIRGYVERGDLVPDQIVAVQVAAHLEVDHDELVRRLLSRGRGSEDTREVIDHRLRVYEEQTRPMIDYYAEREKLVVVNGARPMDEVTWSLEVQLQRVQRLLRD
jgi:adenylate kinase